MKLSPYYSSTGPLRPPASSTAGADGLVLFNRFYQPDIDLDALDVVPRLELSVAVGAAPAAALDRHPAPPARPGVSLAATSGVHSGTDAAKALAVGADVAMMTSALLRHGPDHVAARRAPSCGRGSTTTTTTRSASCAAA